MAKAKAGQSAKKRQERERRPAAHLETVLEEMPERPTPETEAIPSRVGHGLETSPDPHTTEPGRDASPVTADHSGQAEQLGSASNPVRQHDATPEIQAGPDRSIDAPPIGTAKLIREVETVAVESMSDSEPTFASVPQVQADSGAPGATSMDASQGSPRGLMTDRYTVWSGSASRSANAVTPEEGSQPAVQASKPVIPATESSDVDAADHGHGDTGGPADRPVPDTAANQPAPFTGTDLAMSRLRSATGATEPGSRPDTTATGDDIGSTEAALDVAVDQFIAATRTVETTISEPPTTAGATFDSDKSDQVAGATDVGADDAPPDYSGAAGLLDDLAGRLGSAGGSVVDALEQPDDDATDGPDAQAGRSDDPARRVTEIVEQGQNSTNETSDRVRSVASDAAVDMKDTARDVLDQVKMAGAEVADSMKEAGQSTRDDLVEAAGQVSERAHAAGDEVAATVEEGLERAEDRVEQAAGQIAETTEAAANEVAGVIGHAIHDVRGQVTGTAHDLLTIGRDSVAEARTIAADTATDIRSGIADTAGSIAETGRIAVGAVTGCAAEAVQSLTGSVSGAASGLAGTVRSGLGRAESPVTDTVVPTSKERSYNQLIVSALAVGTVSGLNRWAVRRLTGADIAILGPAAIHPAILGSGLAALVASLYLSEE